MKILYLTLYKEPFIEILEGRKKNEYRRNNEYWRKRLINPDGTAKIFDIIQFTNGYGKHRPAMRVEWLGVTIIDKILDAW